MRQRAPWDRWHLAGLPSQASGSPLTSAAGANVSRRAAERAPAVPGGASPQNNLYFKVHPSSWYHPIKPWRRGDRDTNGSHAAC